MSWWIVILITIGWIVASYLSWWVLYSYWIHGEPGGKSIEDTILAFYIVLMPAVLFVFVSLVMGAAGGISWLTVLFTVLGWNALVVLIEFVRMMVMRREKDAAGFMLFRSAFLWLFFLVIPSLLIVVYYGIIYLGLHYKTAFFIFLIMLVCAMFLVPVIGIAVKLISKKRRCTPEHVAEWSEADLNGFDKYREEYSIIYKKDEGRKLEISYVRRQIHDLKDKLGILYDFSTVKKRQEYAEAILKNCKKDLPDLKAWEFCDVVDRETYRARSDVFLHFTDGESVEIETDWRTKYVYDRLIKREQERADTAKRFYNVTLTGRLYYLFLCIERYMTTLYPDADWEPVVSRMWDSVSSPKPWKHDAEGNCYKFLVPKYFGDSEAEFSSEAAYRIADLYHDLPRGEAYIEFDRLMTLPLTVMEDHAVWLEEFNRGEYTMACAVKEAEDILASRKIPIPKKEFLGDFTFERKRDYIRTVRANRAGGGFGTNGRHLSEILGKK